MVYLLLLAPLILGFLANRKVTGTFKTWSEVRSSTGRTGAEVARAILDRNGLHDVEVLHTPGHITDHYDPRKRTVNLSDSVFGSNSVAAISVAAHEVGHAIQHQKAYAPLAIRSAIVPVTNFASAAFNPIFMIGIVMMFAGSAFGLNVILAAIALYSLAVIFQLVTLPVEFDASRRAKKQMQELALMPAGGQEAVGTQKVLSAAAMTYVAAALASILTLAYFVIQFVIPQD